jgi:integrase
MVSPATGGSVSVYDRWWKTQRQPDGSARRVPSNDYGCERRWQVRWRDENGKQRKRSFARKSGSDPEKCAEAFDAKVKTQLDDGSYVDPANASVRFQAFAEDWRKSRTHDVVTASRVERELRLHVYPVIGGRTLRELGKRPSLVQAWISGIKLAPSSARQVIRDVSSVFIAAMDDGLISRNPVQAKSVTRPKVPEKKAQPWTLGQVEAMADALPGRFAVLPYLGAGTGMRQGELFGLSVDDVDFLRKVIHVRRQVWLIAGKPCFAPVKNGKMHDVPLAESLVPVLAEHIRLHPPVSVTLPWRVPGGKPITFSLLVTRPGGTAMDRTRFGESHWRPAQERAGIVVRHGGKRPAARDQGMHALRHTAASAWLAAGVDIVGVAAWLGDTVKTVWETYAHLMPDADDRGRTAMDLFFTGGASARDVPAGGR